MSSAARGNPLTTGLASFESPAASPMDLLDKVLEEKLPVIPEQRDSCVLSLKEHCGCKSACSSAVPKGFVPLKRSRVAKEPEPLEIDFTEMFARPTKTKKQPQSTVEIVVQPPAADRCGFCLCASSSASAQNDE